MNGDWTFENALHEFQHGLVQAWTSRFRVGQKIAISIQLRREIQDRRKSCCAGDVGKKVFVSNGIPKAINNYCQHVLNDGAIDKCDKLDELLKSRHVSEQGNGKATHELKGFSCRCHRGVSNILIPFRFGSEEWYIFFGQFLLHNEHPDIDSDILLEQRIQPVKDLAPNEQGLLQEDVLITDDQYNKYFKLWSDGTGTDISLIPVSDFLKFKGYVLKKSADFMTFVYQDEGRVESLKLYKLQANARTLRTVCGALRTAVVKTARRNLTDTAHRNETFTVIDWLLAAADRMPEQKVASCIAWAQRGREGALVSAEWLNEGKQFVATKGKG